MPHPLKRWRFPREFERIATNISLRLSCLILSAPKVSCGFEWFQSVGFFFSVGFAARKDPELINNAPNLTLRMDLITKGTIRGILRNYLKKEPDLE